MSVDTPRRENMRLQQLDAERNRDEQPVPDEVEVEPRVVPRDLSLPEQLGESMFVASDVPRFTLVGDHRREIWFVCPMEHLDDARRYIGSIRYYIDRAMSLMGEDCFPEYLRRVDLEALTFSAPKVGL